MFTYTIFQSKQEPDSKVTLDLLYHVVLEASLAPRFTPGLYHLKLIKWSIMWNETFLVEKKLHTLRQFKSNLTDIYNRITHVTI